MLGSGMFNMYDAANVWANDSAVFFDGVNDFAEIEMPAAVNAGVRNTFTLSLWVKSHSATINADFVIWYHEETNPSDNALQYLWYDESEEQIKFTRTDRDGNNPATSITTHRKGRMAEWNHIVVIVVHDSDMKMFVNAADDDVVSLADSPDSWTAAPANMYYGVNGTTNNVFFNGYINNVAIWNDSFGGTKIEDIYNEGRPKNELESYDNLYFYHVSNEKTFISDTGYQVATFGAPTSIERVAYSGAIVVSKPV